MTHRSHGWNSWWRPRAFRTGAHPFAAIVASLAFTAVALPEAISWWRGEPWRVSESLSSIRAISIAPVLTDADALLYKNVMASQKREAWSVADAQLAQIHTPLLHATLLAQRYLNPDYRPSEAEMTSWLERYPTHPHTEAVKKRSAELFPSAIQVPESLVSANTKLALSLRPLSTMASEPTVRYGNDPRLESALSASERSGVDSAIARVREQLDSDHSNAALATISAASRSLSPLATDALRWQAATAFFSHGHMADAERLGSDAADRSGERFPAMHWVAGMAAWEQDHTSVARAHFHRMAMRASMLPSGDASAALFWAARGWESAGYSHEAEIFLTHAAARGEHFYAHLARAQLGTGRIRASQALLQQARLLAHGYMEASMAMHNPGVVRALAWQQLGEKSLAQWELAHAFSIASTPDRGVIAHVAGRMNLPGLQLAMARQLPRQLADLSAYPVVQWQPKSGFSVAPALMFGIARQESGFNTSATSPAGARGLMQMMPQTAKYVAAMEPAAGSARDKALADPATNFSLGQRYIEYLAQKPYVDQDLVLLLAAYNAGPKAAIQWSERKETSADPIAFIERISFPETRAYVQKVLANSWTYDALLGGRAESLQALVNGDWPTVAFTGKHWFAADAGTQNTRARVN